MNEGIKMTRTKIATEKLANNVNLVLMSRLLMLLTPVVASAGTFVLYHVYTAVLEVQAMQTNAIEQLNIRVNRHEVILENGKQSRLEFQERTVTQFNNLDTKVEKMLDGITDIRESVVRVQTIVETRLPQKATELGEKKWPQQ